MPDAVETVAPHRAARNDDPPPKPSPMSTTSAPTDTPSSEHAKHPARGKVVGRRDGLLLFKPRGTAYELHLACDDFTGTLDKPVEGQIVIQARKAYTVSSGGNFVAPITGTPRIVQGRVIEVLPDTGGRRRIILSAGPVVVVDLPEDSHAIDLGNGVIEEGALVNVVVLPGATFEPI